jgi:hypothetical protein
MKLSRSRRTKTNIHFKRFGHFSLEINKRSVAKYEKRKREKDVAKIRMVKTHFSSERIYFFIVFANNNKSPTICGI